jgi:hypothetical protein
LRTQRSVLKIDEQQLLERLEEIEKWGNEGPVDLMPYAFSTHIGFTCDFFCLFRPYSVCLNNLLAQYFSEGLLALWTVEKADF